MRRATAGIAIALLAVTASVAAEPKLEERRFLDGKLLLLVPDDFQQMSDAMLRAKYPAERRPTTVLTNPEGSVNVAVNHTQDALHPDRIRESHEVIDRLFRTMYPSAKWNRSEVTSINGREFFILDLVTPGVDTEIRNVMSVTSLDERFLIITFNCTREREGEWGAIGRRIIESASFGD